MPGVRHPTSDMPRHPTSPRHWLSDMIPTSDVPDTRHALLTARAHAWITIVESRQLRVTFSSVQSVQFSSVQSGITVRSVPPCLVLARTRCSPSVGRIRGVVMSLCRYVVMSLCRHVSLSVVMCRYAVVSLCRYVVMCRYLSLCRWCRYVVIVHVTVCPH